MDIVSLLVVTFSGNICAIASWLLIDMFHVLYFCYFCVALITHFINEMGGNTGDNCSLFTTTTAESNDCRGLRTQFKSVITVLMIAFIIIPIEVGLFISVNAFRHNKLLLRSETETKKLKENKDQKFIKKDDDEEGKKTFKRENR